MLRYVAVLTLILCALLPCARAANPANAANAEPPAADPRAALLKLLPAGSKLEDLRPSPIAGIYEYSQGAEISYLTADGKYFIDGNLYDMKSRDNLTEALRMHARVALINATRACMRSASVRLSRDFKSYRLPSMKYLPSAVK